jgi:hypothetical protein
MSVEDPAGLDAARMKVFRAAVMECFRPLEEEHGFVPGDEVCTGLSFMSIEYRSSAAGVDIYVEKGQTCLAIGPQSPTRRYDIQLALQVLSPETPIDFPKCHDWSEPELRADLIRLRDVLLGPCRRLLRGDFVKLQAEAERIAKAYEKAHFDAWFRAYKRSTEGEARGKGVP